MEIIFDGQCNAEEAAEHLAGILRLFKERYRIHHFNEMHLSIALMDEEGYELELVDSETTEVYRVVEVYSNREAVRTNRRAHPLTLVVDNTRKL